MSWTQVLESRDNAVVSCDIPCCALQPLYIVLCNLNSLVLCSFYRLFVDYSWDFFPLSFVFFKKLFLFSLSLSACLWSCVCLHGRSHLKAKGKKCKWSVLSLSFFSFFLLREGCWGHESSLFIFADNPINTTYFSVKDRSECVGRINGSSSCVCSPRCVSENIDTLNHSQSHRQARPRTHAHTQTQTNTIGTQRCRRPFLSISDNTHSVDRHCLKHDSESRSVRWPSASSGIDFSHLAGYKFLTVRTLARRWTSAEMSTGVRLTQLLIQWSCHGFSVSVILVLSAVYARRHDGHFLQAVTYRVT